MLISIYFYKGLFLNKILILISIKLCNHYVFRKLISKNSSPWFGTVCAHQTLLKPTEHYIALKLYKSISVYIVWNTCSHTLYMFLNIQFCVFRICIQYFSNFNFLKIIKGKRPSSVYIKIGRGTELSKNEFTELSMGEFNVHSFMKTPNLGTVIKDTGCICITHF